MWRDSAAENGLLAPSPSSATCPGAVANAISVPRRASRRRRARRRGQSHPARCRGGPAEATCGAIGLLRQASRIRMLVRTWSSRPARIVSMSIMLRSCCCRAEAAHRPAPDNCGRRSARRGRRNRPPRPAPRRLAQEIAGRLLHRRAVEIDAFRDGKADVAQALRDRARIVGRIGQRLDMGIGAVADHQRDAPDGSAVPAPAAAVVPPSASARRVQFRCGCRCFAARARPHPTTATGEPLRWPGWPCCRRRRRGLRASRCNPAWRGVVALRLIGEAALGIGRDQHAARRRHDVDRRLGLGEPDRLGGVGDGAVEVALGAPDHGAVVQRRGQCRDRAGSLR